MNGAVAVDEFVLSQDGDEIEIENDRGLVGDWRWIPAVQRGTHYLALAVIAGEAALSPTMAFGHDMVWRCHLMQGLDTLSDDGLVAELFFRSAQTGSEFVLFEIPMAPGRHNEVAATFDLRQLIGLRGRLGIRCKPGPLGDARSDWLAVSRWIVGREDRLGLLNARSHRSWRIRNEIAAFSAVYDHPIYTRRISPANDDDAAALPPANGVAAPRSPAVRPAEPELTADDLIDLPAAQRLPGEDVFNYTNRVLVALIGDGAEIDFATRLKEMSAAVNRPLRFLSLCCGAAGIEREVLTAAAVPIEVTLCDINEQLLDQATSALSRFRPLHRIVGDANTLSKADFDGQFDVVACVSGLHHLVELEHVIRTVADVLTDDGEFWLVCEQIGRDGNRLWPEAGEAANRVFSRLPEELRRNAYTGMIDPEIPDIDYGANCFEGIRSSEIERVVQSFFEPVRVVRRNCFIWRVFAGAYFHNYDLSNEWHRRVALEFVAADYNLWRQGGRPTETFAVYRRGTKGAEVRKLLRS